MGKNNLKARGTTSGSEIVLIPSSTTHERAASDVLLHSDLERIRLRYCQSESAGLLADLTEPFTLSLADPSGKSLGLHGPHLLTEASFQFESTDSSEEHVIVFKVSCAFQLVYHIDDGFIPNKEAQDAFADTFGVFNSWPYAREVIQNLTQRMGLNPPPLPILRILPPSSKRPQAPKKKRVARL
jgi:hypothetical protein